MSNVNGGTITVTVAGKDVGLSDLLARINAQMAASGTSARNYATQMASIDPTLKRTESELAKYATSVANVAAAQGDSIGAQRLLATTLQGMTANTVEANQVLLKLQQNINAEAAAAEKDAAAIQKLAAEKAKLANTPATNTKGTDEQALSLGRLVTAYFVATRVAKEFADVINQGNDLEKTLTTFRVLSGSAQEYEKNLQIAKQQQATFGGSLNDTVEGMSEFANLSHRTGIEVNKLTNLARALATVDPAQGFKGASIALKEFLSGDNVTSLSRRFEIPKEALNSIEKLTDKKQQFAALTAELEKFGISEELVSAQANTTAVSFDKLTGAAADAKAALGTALAAAFEQSAKNITIELTAIANGLTSLATRSQQLQGFAGKIFDQTTTGGIEAFNQKIIETNAAIDGNDPIMGRLIGHLQTLTPAEYAFVSALVAQGTAATDALSALEANRTAVEGIEAALQEATQLYPENINAIQQLNGSLAENASTSAEAAAFSLGLAQAVADGLPPEQAMIALQQFKANQLREVADAQAQLAAQQTVVNAALDEGIIKEISDNQAKEQTKALTQGLVSVLQALGAGTINQAQAESILQGQYGATAAQLPGLIQLTLDLAAARDQERIASNALNQAQTDAQVAKNRAAGRQGRGDSSDAVENANALVSSLQKASQAESDAILRNGTAAQQRNEYNKRLADSVRLYGANSAAAIKAKSDLDAFDISQNKKGGGSPKLSANEKLNTALQDQQDKFNDKFEDAEQKHWDKVADIYAKFNEEQQKQFAKNEVSKRRSRADFYAGLQDAPPGVDTQKFAAQYEQAFAKAQEIAQSGKAKLAEQFLELRQKQIEEMKQLDEEAAKITNQQKEGKISKKDADAQLEFLNGRKKLIEDAQKEEQDQLLNAGDENQNRLNEQLAAEEKAYSDSVDKIGLTAERAADAKIKHAERSKIAVAEENKVLAQQAQYYERIARVNGGQVPANARKSPVPTNTGGTQGDTNETVDVSATSPLPVTTTDALLVKQAELFIVHDVDVMNAIGDMAARIEGKLGEVVLAVNSAKDTISGAVNSVKEAVGKIKAPTQSLVGG